MPKRGPRRSCSSPPSASSEIDSPVRGGSKGKMARRLNSEDEEEVDLPCPVSGLPDCIYKNSFHEQCVELSPRRRPHNRDTQAPLSEDEDEQCPDLSDEALLNAATHSPLQDFCMQTVVDKYHVFARACIKRDLTAAEADCCDVQAWEGIAKSCLVLYMPQLAAAASTPQRKNSLHRFFGMLLAEKFYFTLTDLEQLGVQQQALSVVGHAVPPFIAGPRDTSVVVAKHSLPLTERTHFLCYCKMAAGRAPKIYRAMPDSDLDRTLRASSLGFTVECNPHSGRTWHVHQMGHRLTCTYDKKLEGNSASDRANPHASNSCCFSPGDESTTHAAARALTRSVESCAPKPLQAFFKQHLMMPLQCFCSMSVPQVKQVKLLRASSGNTYNPSCYTGRVLPTLFAYHKQVSPANNTEPGVSSDTDDQGQFVTHCRHHLTSNQRQSACSLYASLHPDCGFTMCAETASQLVWFMLVLGHTYLKPLGLGADKSCQVVDVADSLCYLSYYKRHIPANAVTDMRSAHVDFDEKSSALSF